MYMLGYAFFYNQKNEICRKSIIRFEMDTLEIVLREQMDVVDKFFLGRIY